RRLDGDPGGATPSPTAEELVPAREVPATDPPSIGAESDYHSTIERAQLEEWYAGYLHEVLAARSEGATRQQHLDLTALHRQRAEELGEIAEQDGAPVVARQAVYAVPGGTLDEQSAARLPTLLAQGLLVDHIALVGAAPFERRPLPIAAALQEAERLGALVDRMEPLPSLEVEQPPPGQERRPRAAVRPREAGAGAADLGDDRVDDLVRADRADLAAGAVTRPGQARGAAPADDRRGGRAQQLGGRDLEARGDPGPVAVQHLEAARLELGGGPFGRLEHHLPLAGGHDVHIGGCELAGPGQALLVVVQLGDGGHGAGDADAVGAHGHHGRLAVLVEDGEVERLGVLAAELEDVPHLHAAGQAQRAGAVGRGVAVAHLRGLDGPVGGEVPAEHEVVDVLVLLP